MALAELRLVALDGARVPRPQLPTDSVSTRLPHSMATEPDLQIIRAAADGQDGALGEVLSFLYPIVRRFLTFRFPGLRSAVEDATQDCMIEIIRSLKSYKGEGSLRSWALKLSFRTARRLRDRSKKHDGPTEDDLPEDVFSVMPEDRGLAVDMMRALSQVSQKKRDALILTEVMGLTASDAARILGTFENTVRSRARHAKAELRALLEDREVAHAVR